MYRLPRYLLIALMIVLLPLRGWAGDIMAVDMAATTVMQAKMAGATDETSQAAMPADCIMQPQAPSDDVAAHCCHGETCETCELCLAVASLSTAPWVSSPLVRHSSPLALSASFTSAASAANLKPPIF